MSVVWLWIGYGLLYVASVGAGIVCGGMMVRIACSLWNLFSGMMKARK